MCASKGAAVEAFCLLQDGEEGTVDPKELAFPKNLPSAPCFQKTVDGLCPSLPNKTCATEEI